MDDPKKHSPSARLEAAGLLAQTLLGTPVNIGDKKHTLLNVLRNFHDSKVKEFNGHFEPPRPSYEQSLTEEEDWWRRAIADPSIVPDRFKKHWPKLVPYIDGTLPVDEEKIKELARYRLHSIFGDPRNFDYLGQLIETLDTGLTKNARDAVPLLRDTSGLEWLIERHAMETEIFGAPPERTHFEEFIGQKIEPKEYAEFTHNMMTNFMAPMIERDRAVLNALTQTLETVKRINFVLGLGPNPDEPGTLLDNATKPQQGHAGKIADERKDKGPPQVGG